MLYVVDTPPVFNVTQGNNDDGKTYGLTGFMSYPKMLDLQEIVELWSQYYGGIMGEWQEGGSSPYTRWGFWFPYDASISPLGTDSFKPSRTFFDWNRFYDLCYTSMPIGYNSIHMTHKGALFLDADPLSLYPDYCAQNVNFANCDYSEGSIESLFGDVAGVDGNWYYNDTSTTGLTRALPLKDLCGTQPFKPNQFKLEKDLVSLWRNVKNVANPYLYMLTPESTMFSNGSFGQPFDRAYNQPSTYVRQRRRRMTNSVYQSDDFDTGFQPYYSGYYNTTFTEHHEWYRTAEDIDNDTYQYAWYGQDDKITKTNSDQWLWKDVPIPSSTFGQQVALSRNLLIVWKVEYRAGYRNSNQSSITWTKNYWGNNALYYVTNSNYEPGSSTSQFTDIDGQYNYGLVQQWRFPFARFESTSDTTGQSFPERIMADLVFTTSLNPQGGWGSDTSVHQKTSSYLHWQGAEIDITPIFFYSCEKNKLTQNVTYPQT